MAELPVDVRELLATPSEDIERPRPLADGHYMATINGVPEWLRAQNESQTHICRWNFNNLEECDDVPADANKGMDLSRKELRSDFFITKDAVYRLYDAVDGVLGKKPGVGADERLGDLAGQRVQLGVRQQKDRRTGELRPFNEIYSVVAA
jgi:hypothetical protein